MKIKSYILVTFFALIVSACKDFDAIEKNPNVATSVPASLVLTSVENGIIEEPWSLEHRHNQYWACNYYYYGNNEYSWTNAELSYDVLRDVVKMEEEALKAGASDVNPYAALGKFFRARIFIGMTNQVGDLPMKNALKGLVDISPVYDTQKDIYIQVLRWLDDANGELRTLETAGNTTLSGDIFLNNDLNAWRKVINSYTLRVLISLSKKEGDADLSIKSRFAAILADPAKYPLMTGNSDNLQIEYNGTTSLYPTNPGSKGFDKGRYNMAQTYVEGLTTLKDPRAFVTLNPAKAKLNSGVAFNDFAAYVGASSGESQDDMTFKAGNGEYSYANQLRYYSTFAGPEPALQIGYAEQCFNIAEGIHRGWATGNAETYYVNGIKASMTFYGIEQGSSLTVTDQEDKVLGTVTADIAAYLAQPTVKYSGATANGLNQILTQKYLAFFQNSGLEAFYNQRRTGVPTFLTGPGTGFGGATPRIPKRWLYPSAEETTNSANLRVALQSQFGGQDTKDGELWILK
jgi:Starch-binding associating with outer membrane